MVPGLVTFLISEAFPKRVVDFTKPNEPVDSSDPDTPPPIKSFALLENSPCHEPDIVTASCAELETESVGITLTNWFASPVIPSTSTCVREAVVAPLPEKSLPVIVPATFNPGDKVFIVNTATSDESLILSSSSEPPLSLTVSEPCWGSSLL